MAANTNCSKKGVKVAETKHEIYIYFVYKQVFIKFMLHIKKVQSYGGGSCRYAVNTRTGTVF